MCKEEFSGWMLVEPIVSRRQEFTNLALSAWESHFQSFVAFVPICFLPCSGGVRAITLTFCRRWGLPALPLSKWQYLRVQFTAGGMVRNEQ